MHTGMLWFDNSKTDLHIKIKKAAQYYEKKHGRAPDLCLIHPSMVKENWLLDEGIDVVFPIGETKIRVQTYRPVLPGHIWVGMEEKQS